MQSIAKMQWIIDTDSTTHYDNWIKPKNEVLPIANSRVGFEYRIDEDQTDWYSLVLNSFLIKIDTSYFYYGQNKQWQTVSETLPTQEQFIEKGMGGLSLIDRKVQNLSPQPMTDKSEILAVDETGKLFSKKLDLKKYIDIRSIKAVKK